MIVIVVCGLVAAIFAVLAGMLMFGTAEPPPPLASVSEPFERVDFSDLPPVATMLARDHSPLAYRVWRAASSKDAPPVIVIAIHGSSASSASQHPLGRALAARGITVYAPDIRGHGDSGRRGDIDYATQLDDDFADFTAMVAMQNPGATLVLMGFSSGGGFALHEATTPASTAFARTVLLSPMLGVQAPTVRPQQPWAKPFIPRIIAIALLNKVGVHAFDHLAVLKFAIPPQRADILVGQYSWLLMRGFGTGDYAADLRRATTPLAVVVGSADELFFADKFAPTVQAIRPEVPVAVVPDLGHVDLTIDPRAIPAIVAAVRGTT